MDVRSVVRSPCFRCCPPRAGGAQLTLLLLSPPPLTHRAGRVRQLAYALVARGVKPGDRVLVCGPNCPWVADALQAIPAVRAIVVPIKYPWPSLSLCPPSYSADHHLELQHPPHRERDGVPALKLGHVPRPGRSAVRAPRPERDRPCRRLSRHLHPHRPLRAIPQDGSGRGRATRRPWMAGRRAEGRTARARHVRNLLCVSHLTDRKDRGLMPQRGQTRPALRRGQRASRRPTEGPTSPPSRTPSRADSPRPRSTSGSCPWCTFLSMAKGARALTPPNGGTVPLRRLVLPVRVHDGHVHAGESSSPLTASRVVEGG